jgi:hypothetical protein
VGGPGIFMHEFNPSLQAARAKCLAAGARGLELIPLWKGPGRGRREVLEACVQICAVAAGEPQLDSALARIRVVHGAVPRRCR